jgi:hypothetical protein
VALHETLEIMARHKRRPPHDSANAEKHAECLGKALDSVLPASDPPRPIRAKTRGESPAAGFPLAGSEVLDVTGPRGEQRREMHDIIHAPDDDIVERHLGPHEEASVSFHPEPDIGDAGADLAEELGRTYLEAASSGRDMSELENPDEPDPSEVGGPFLEVSLEGGAHIVGDDDIALASEPISGEVPPELEDAGDEVCPPDPPRGRTRRRSHRAHG